uniref:FAM110_C domain-containing protein n=1 Tax=Heterorhabditis bacteriophora TaxID=37862 RepID=A0A1I7XRR2_HETBA
MVLLTFCLKAVLFCEIYILNQVVYTSTSRMLSFISRDSSAAELLEASKKLYVKTDLLKQRRVEPGQPRLFESADGENLSLPCKRIYQPILGSEGVVLNEFHSVLSPPFPCIPSPHSAFRPPNETPPRPPKSEHIRQQITRLRSQELPHSPPPVPPRRLNYEITYLQKLHTEYELKPIPKPRLSIMNSFSSFSNLNKEYPRPKPRQKTTIFNKIPPQVQEPSFNTYIPYEQKKAKSSLNLSMTHFSVAALKRKITLVRPATPLISMQYTVSPPMFPLMDESERVFLNEAVRHPYSTSSDDERTHPCSSKSIDDGFFDISVRKREDDTSSELLTSISNLQCGFVDVCIEEEDRGRGVSVLERNARVIRWIRDCELESAQ